VFTARYALIPYIKQIRFVFKGLKKTPKLATISLTPVCPLCTAPKLQRSTSSGLVNTAWFISDVPDKEAEDKTPYVENT
jgi:hypothetical protein